MIQGHTHPRRVHSRRAAGGAALWLLGLVAILALSGWAWWYYAPDSLPEPLRKQLPVSKNANPVLYKWRDAQGRWQVTDQAPTDRPYETVLVDPNTNVLPSGVPPEQ